MQSLPYNWKSIEILSWDLIWIFPAVAYAFLNIIHHLALIYYTIDEVSE